VIILAENKCSTLNGADTGTQGPAVEILSKEYLPMRLNEFANPNDFTLSAADMARLLKRLTRVWRDVGIDATAPFVQRLVNEPKDVRQMLADRHP
jgi:hypothetical protein